MPYRKAHVLVSVEAACGIAGNFVFSPPECSLELAPGDDVRLHGLEDVSFANPEPQVKPGVQRIDVESVAAPFSGRRAGTVVAGLSAIVQPLNGAVFAAVKPRERHGVARECPKGD